MLKGDKAKIRTQQYIKLNTGAKDIQQLNPGGPDNMLFAICFTTITCYLQLLIPYHTVATILNTLLLK